MTYYESAEGITITRRRAVAELAEHCIVSAEDVNEALVASQVAGVYQYDAQLLLQWLGY